MNENQAGTMSEGVPSESTATRMVSLDVGRLRMQFPALQRKGPTGHPLVYLDSPGGTQVPQRVVDAVGNYLVESNSNIEGEFAASRSTDELILKAREYGSTFVGGQQGSVTFGQNMTTLNFLLSRAVGRTLQPGDEILTTTLDHDANVSPWLLLAQDRGLVVREIGVTDDLQLDMDELRKKITKRTRVVAFTLASNAVGTLTPARQIADLAHEAGALVWVDAVHFAPHRRIDVVELGCDVLICSPYKFFGPHLGMAWIGPDLAEGLPAERVRPASEWPLGHRFETGTLSHEALAGFVAAVEYLADLGHGANLSSRLSTAYAAIAVHEQTLAEHFLAGFRSLDGWRLLGVEDAVSSNRVSTFGLLGPATPSVLARQLGDNGIYVWNGNFYALNLVRHLGLDEEQGLLRLGFCHYNTVDEVDYLLGALAEMTSG